MVSDDEIIGRIKAPGFKQTYDRILSGLISEAVSSQTNFNRLAKTLYSNNFYPISEHTKRETVRVHLKALVKAGRLTRIGSDKTGHWQINNSSFASSLDELLVFSL